MQFKLSDNVKAGEKIRTACGWRVVKEVTSEGVIVKEGLVRFGDQVYGWKKQ